jgi:hypothetical protein
LVKSTSYEEKARLEILSDLRATSLVRYGYWINPIGKSGGFRVAPIDFAPLGIKAEVPRTYMNNRIIMTVHWLSFDYLSQGQYQ